MLPHLYLALFLPCAVLSAVFVVYLCFLWSVALTHWNPNEFGLPEKPTSEGGLSASELEKLPKVTGKNLVMRDDCAICLDDIGGEQPARLVPGCNHGFHLQCADAWLSKNSVCPVCRHKLDHKLFDPSENNPY